MHCLLPGHLACTRMRPGEGRGCSPSVLLEQSAVSLDAVVDASAAQGVPEEGLCGGHHWHAELRLQLGQQPRQADPKRAAANEERIRRAGRRKSRDAAPEVGGVEARHLQVSAEVEMHGLRHDEAPLLHQGDVALVHASDVGRDHGDALGAERPQCRADAIPHGHQPRAWRELREQAVPADEEGKRGAGDSPDGHITLRQPQRIGRGPDLAVCKGLLVGLCADVLGVKSNLGHAHVHARHPREQGWALGVKIHVRGDLDAGEDQALGRREAWR
mmetsp:Transcript_85675/g.255371  ORF Transcript_85675/g.255371 Transcript_85675/m.255371 type:complete len:273 (+) Transcript_85675:31-849(+)